MFTRKQYVYRNITGDDVHTPESDTDKNIDLIGTYRDNMPYGSLACIYKTEDDFDTDYTKAVFAISTIDGLKFYQADDEGGMIYTMWKPGIAPYRFGTGAELAMQRKAFHIDDTTECGHVFMNASILNMVGDIKDYMYFNVLPFKSAYYKYRDIAAENDVRNYVLCSSASGGKHYWGYTLNLVPSDDNIKKVSEDPSLSAVIPSKYYNSYRTAEGALTMRARESTGSTQLYQYNFAVPYVNDKEATSSACYLFSVASWGEITDSLNDYSDSDSYKYFKVYTAFNPIADPEHKTMYNNIVITDDKVSFAPGYIDQENKENYNEWAVALSTESDNDTITDTVLKINTIADRFLYKTIYNRSDNSYKISLGNFIYPDNVSVFIFDSCLNDNNMKAIREALLKKYNTQIISNDNSDVLLCYMPDLSLMENNSDSSDWCKLIKACEQGKPTILNN